MVIVGLIFIPVVHSMKCEYQKVTAYETTIMSNFAEAAQKVIIDYFKIDIKNCPKEKIVKCYKDCTLYGTLQIQIKHPCYKDISSGRDI